MKYAIGGTTIQADPAHPGGRVERHVELQGDDVVHAGQREDRIERQGHRTDTGTHRDVTRTLQEVVMCGVAGELRLDPRVTEQTDEQHADQGDHPEDRRDRVRPR